MRKFLLLCTLAALAPSTALAQPTAPAPLATGGMRLDILATGEVTRTPDQVMIMAGVVTRSLRAEDALRDNAARMERVRAALRRAGIQPRDVQTGTISLSQDYEQGEAGNSRPSGYAASNQLYVRFRDITMAGRIIDALVAEGANSVNGPTFGIGDREGALDEARARALAVGRTRADLYARALGTRVRRIVSVSESGQQGLIMAEATAMRSQAGDASTQVEPGEQVVGISLTITFELDQPGG